MYVRSIIAFELRCVSHMTVVKRKGRIAELTFGIESSEIPTEYSVFELGYPFKIDKFTYMVEIH